MGECFITRRGGEKSGLFAYESIQHFESAIITVSNLQSGTHGIVYGDAYTFDTTTGLFIITNGQTIDTLTDSNKYLLVGKIFTGTGAAYGAPTCVLGRVTSIAEVSENNFYYNGSYSNGYGKKRIRIDISDGALYPSETIVGNEIRKDL